MGRAFLSRRRPGGLEPEFASDYIKVLRSLSRKHKGEDKASVQASLRVLRDMSRRSFLAGRGELWVPEPDPLTGHYPIIEDVPYNMVRRALRKNTGENERERAWGIVAASAEPFVPLFAKSPGTLDEAQRRRLLAHIMVSLPWTRGRYPALLGKRVPGELETAEIGTRSVIPIQRIAPEEWAKGGFTMRKFSLSEDISKAVQRALRAVPRVRNPQPRPPRVDLKKLIRERTRLRVGLEPETYRLKWVTPVAGLAGGLLLEHLVGRGLERTRTPMQRERKVLRPGGKPIRQMSYADRLCYEDGVGEWLKRARLRTGHVWKKGIGWVRREVVPTALRGATVGVAELAQTEIGMGPTTVDLVPIQRIGLKRTLQPFASSQLRGVVKDLQKHLVTEADPVLRRGLERGIADITTELAVRRALV